MKTCKKCSNKFDITNMSGNSGICKNCRRLYDREYYHINQAKIRAARISQGEEVRNRNRQFVLDYLLKHPCIDCGLSDIRVLEFDHREPELKVTSISEMIRNFSLAKIENEISKCDVRCANCHRIKTCNQFGHWRSEFLPL